VQRLLSILVSAGAVITPAVAMAAAPASAAPLARSASISAGAAVAAAPASSATAKFVALAAPLRVLDTRAGAAPAPVAQGATVSVPVTGADRVPAGATAAVLNVTVVGPAPVGFWTVWPHDQARPVASNINIDARTSGLADFAVPNMVTVPLGPSGIVDVFSQTGGNLVVDLLGYYAPAS
jgi:hypothetical protein